MKKSVTRLLLIICTSSAVGLTGCASLPSRDAMKSEVENFNLPRKPEQGKGLVYVVRPSGVGGLIRFNVFIDDQKPESEVGFTRGSQYIYFNVEPGERKIQSKAENWAEWVLNVKPGDIFFIQQEPSMGIIMARNTIFAIDDIQGKYHVKTLQLGTVLKSQK